MVSFSYSFSNVLFFAASRGYMPYIAPEILSEDNSGVYSFSSDFWGLGCLLYELRRGAAPFGVVSPGNESELIERYTPVSYFF